jgi:DNA-binding transcriptional LysR family regulator
MPVTDDLCSTDMDVELRHLRAFTAVATERSFTAASRQLLITQPALTRTVQQLETALGVQLLERTSRKVELTDAGRSFLVHVQGVLRDLDLAVAEAVGERELRIGFAWILPAPWITETIAAFEAATGAAARLVRRDDLEASLRQGEIDVALTRIALHSHDVVEVGVFEESRVAAVGARSPLASHDHLTWAELARHPVVMNTRSGNTRAELWPEHQRPQQIIKCDNYDEWIAEVAAGHGVGATALSASLTFVHPEIVYLPLVDAPPVTLHLSWSRRRDGVLVRRFREITLTRRSLYIEPETNAPDVNGFLTALWSDD